MPNCVAQVVSIDEAKLIAKAVASPLLVTPDFCFRCWSFRAYGPFANAANAAGKSATLLSPFKNWQASVNGFGYLYHATLRPYDGNRYTARGNTISNQHPVRA